MNHQEALEYIHSLGLDPEAVVPSHVRLQDVFMLNELIDAAREWRKTTLDLNAINQCTARLVNAIDAYLAAENRNQNE